MRAIPRTRKADSPLPARLGAADRQLGAVAMPVRRLSAELVDLVLATALAFVVSELFAQLIRGTPLSWAMTDTNDLVLFLWSIACVGSTLLFAHRWHRGEPTPGYQIFGLRLRDLTTHGVLS